MNLSKFYAKFIMDMCTQKTDIPVIFLIILILSGIFLGSCEAIDSILPSAGTYKINIQINDTSLDELSFVVLSDIIRPVFEEPVSDDPDITALMIFLRNSAGETVGERIVYRLKQDDHSGENKNEITVLVQSLDGNLPSFPLPAGLPVGTYTIISQIMGGKNILQRTEKPFFYLDEIDFAFEGIDVHLPGTPESSQLIPRGTTVMLEAKLDFDQGLDPYIAWYNGRRKISEGNFSQGAGQLFWKVPEQTGFFSLRAEVFPARSHERLAGFQRQISLLVSSKAMDIHLVSDNNSQLLHWYVFEGNLNDSKMIVSEDRALSAAGNPGWMGLDGTYGLVTDRDSSVSLPLINMPNDAIRTWQTKIRFFPLNDGAVFSVLFGYSKNVNLSLFIEDQNLVLSLSSPSQDSFKTINLPAAETFFDEFSDNSQIIRRRSFITASINFSILPGMITAQIIDTGGHFNGEDSVTLQADAGDVFQIILGFAPENSAFAEELSDHQQEGRQEAAMLWDEFALYYLPTTEIRTEGTGLPAGERQPQFPLN